MRLPRISSARLLAAAMSRDRSSSEYPERSGSFGIVGPRIRWRTRQTIGKSPSRKGLDCRAATLLSLSVAKPRGPQGRPLLIQFQRQCPLEKMPAAIRTADIDEGGPGKVAFEHRKRPLPGISLEVVEGLVDDHPARLVQRQLGERQEALIVLAELALPARRLVEIGLEPVEADLSEHRAELVRAETVGCRRIGQHRA